MEEWATSSAWIMTALPLKRCSQCHVDKPFAEFYKAARRKDGFRSECKQCLKQYYPTNNARYAANRETMVAITTKHRHARRAVLNWWKSHPCGRRFPPVAMDFDHVRGTKAHAIVASTISRPDAIYELAKCQLRCAVCHRIRHYGIT